MSRRRRPSNGLDLEHEDSEFLRAMNALGSVPDKDDKPAATSSAANSGRSRASREAAKGNARRGEPVLEVLDLHGTNSEQALRRLESFIQRTWASGRREVLIITGKGRRSSGGVPVLKHAVQRWLKGPGRDRVDGFEEAHARLGGTGALRVRLRPRTRRSS